jgi:hypothetical protein
MEIRLAVCVFAAILCAVLLGACNNANSGSSDDATAQAQLPEGVTHDKPGQGSGALTDMPGSVRQPSAGEMSALGGTSSGSSGKGGDGVIGGQRGRVLLDSKRRLGGPYPNSTMAVFSPMVWDAAVGRLENIQALQEMIDSGSVVFIPNGLKVDYEYETQAGAGFVAIRYEGKRWYVQEQDATRVE